MRLHLELGNGLIVHDHLDYLAVELGITVQRAHLDHEVLHLTGLLVTLRLEVGLDFFIVCFQLLNN